MNKYDKWHFIFTFLIVYICAFVAHPFLSGRFMDAFPTAGDVAPVFVFGGLLVGALLATALQGWNESMQWLSEKEVARHGGLERFRKNSRLDWKLFFVGGFLGAFTYLITLSLI